MYVCTFLPRYNSCAAKRKGKGGRTHEQSQINKKEGGKYNNEGHSDLKLSSKWDFLSSFEISVCGGGTGRASYVTCAPSSRSKFILFLFLSFPPSLSSSLLGNRRRGGGFELQPSSTLKATRKGNSSVERKEEDRDSRGPRPLTPIRFYLIDREQYKKRGERKRWKFEEKEIGWDVRCTYGRRRVCFCHDGRNEFDADSPRVTMEANSDKTTINPVIFFFFFSVGSHVTQGTRFAP